MDVRFCAKLTTLDITSFGFIAATILDWWDESVRQKESLLVELNYQSNCFRSLLRSLSLSDEMTYF